MDVTPLIPEGRQIIQAYPAGGFKVSGVSYDGAVLVMPDKTVIWPAPADLSKIRADDFSLLFDHADDVDVLLFGMGTRAGFLPPSVRADLRAKNLVIDAMDTGAACRTYNVLMAEGRRVAAALMPVK